MADRFSSLTECRIKRWIFCVYAECVFFLHYNHCFWLITKTKLWQYYSSSSLKWCKKKIQPLPVLLRNYGQVSVIWCKNQTVQARHLHPPSIQRASLLSLPCSHHSCFHPRCMRLPSPSPGAPLWRLGSAAAAAAASPAGCSLHCLVPSNPQPNTAQHPALSSGGGKKRFKLHIQPTKQGRPDVSSSTGPENLNVHWRLLICFFIAEKIYLSALSLLLSASTLSLIYFRKSRHVSCCW